MCRKLADELLYLFRSINKKDIIRFRNQTLKHEKYIQWQK